MAHFLNYSDYTIGWICALRVELLAARFMLDSKHEGIFPGKPGDDNDYIPGTIGGHNVVIVGLALKSTGTVSAATLAQSMRSSFPNIEYGLVVGIGAGVPGANLQPDIRLGDVIVGTPGDSDNEPQGVIGYELGKETLDGFVKTNWLCPTHRRLRNAIGRIRGDNEHDGKNTFITHLQSFNATPTGKRFSIPNQESDVLYEAETDNRLAAVEITRPPREISEPVVHYGLIASGDKLIRTAKLRDQLRDRYGIICFEMEAAGVMNTLPVAVIRGVSDYADSRKNDEWHHYAAATAAAYAKGLLLTIGPDTFRNPQPQPPPCELS